MMATPKNYDLDRWLPGIMNTAIEAGRCRWCDRKTSDPVEGHDGYCPVPALFTLAAHRAPGDAPHMTNEAARTLQMQKDVSIVSRYPELYGDEHAHNIRAAFEKELGSPRPDAGGMTALRDAAQALISYRERQDAISFQLEKLDDYIRALDKALSATPAPAPAVDDVVKAARRDERHNAFNDAIRIVTRFGGETAGAIASEIARQRDIEMGHEPNVDAPLAALRAQEG